jgi:hypothetical protein
MGAAILAMLIIAVSAWGLKCAAVIVLQCAAVIVYYRIKDWWDKR